MSESGYDTATLKIEVDTTKLGLATTALQNFATETKKLTAIEIQNAQLSLATRKQDLAEQKHALSERNAAERIANKESARLRKEDAADAAASEKYKQSIQNTSALMTNRAAEQAGAANLAIQKKHRDFVLEDLRKSTELEKAIHRQRGIELAMSMNDRFKNEQLISKAHSAAIVENEQRSTAKIKEELQKRVNLGNDIMAIQARQNRAMGLSSGKDYLFSPYAQDPNVIKAQSELSNKIGTSLVENERKTSGLIEAIHKQSGETLLQQWKSRGVLANAIHKQQGEELLAIEKARQMKYVLSHNQEGALLTKEWMERGRLARSIHKQQGEILMIEQLARWEREELLNKAHGKALVEDATRTSNALKAIQNQRETMDMMAQEARWKTESKLASTPQRSVFQTAGISSVAEDRIRVDQLKTAMESLHAEYKAQNITKAEYLNKKHQINAATNVAIEGNARHRGAIRQTAAAMASLTFEMTGALYGVIAITTALGAPAFFGIKFLRSIEDAKVGIAGTLQAMSNVSGAGQTWSQSMTISETAINKLAAASVKYNVSLEDVTKTFQAIVGQGMAAGMTLEQIGRIATIGTMAVKSMNIESRQAVQEVRDLVQGGIQAASSTVATALGITDAMVKKWKEAGTLFDELEKRMSGYTMAAMERQNTLSGALDILKIKIQRLFSDEGGFKAFKDIINNISNAIGKINYETGQIEFNPELVKTVKSYWDILEGAARSLGTVLEYSIKFAAVGKELAGMFVSWRAGIVIWPMIAGGVTAAGAALMTFMALPFWTTVVSLITGIGAAFMNLPLVFASVGAAFTSTITTMEVAATGLTTRLSALSLGMKGGLIGIVLFGVLTSDTFKDMIDLAFNNLEQRAQKLYNSLKTMGVDVLKDKLKTAQEISYNKTPGLFGSGEQRIAAEQISVLTALIAQKEKDIAISNEQQSVQEKIMAGTQASIALQKSATDSKTKDAMSEKFANERATIAQQKETAIIGLNERVRKVTKATNDAERWEANKTAEDLAATRQKIEDNYARSFEDIARREKEANKKLNKEEKITPTQSVLNELYDKYTNKIQELTIKTEGLSAAEIIAAETKQKLTKAHGDVTQAMVEEVIAKANSLKGEDELNKQLKYGVEYRNDYWNEIDKETASINEKAKQQEFENTLIGKTKEEIDKLTKQRESDSIATWEQNLATEIKNKGDIKDIALIEEHISALKRKKAAEEGKTTGDAVSAAVADHAKFISNIADDMSKALVQSVMHGESFANAITKSIEKGIEDVAVKTIKLKLETIMGGNLEGKKSSTSDWVMTVIAIIGGIISSGTASAAEIAAVTAAEVQKKQGTGTVAGEMLTQTQSIADSLSLLEKTSFAANNYTIDMVKSLKAIENSMKGFINIIGVSLGGDIAAAMGVSSESTSGSKASAYNTRIGNVMHPTLGSFGTSAAGGDSIGGAFRTKMNNFVWGTVTKTVTDTGLVISGLLSDLTVQRYAAGTKKSSGMFGFLGGKTSTWSQTSAKDDALSAAITNVYSNLREGFKSVATSIGMDMSLVDTAFDGFTTTIGKLSLHGMTADEQLKALNSAISKDADLLANQLFPAFVQFQQAGEGLLETVIRLVTEMSIFTDFLARSGKGSGISGQQGFATDTFTPRLTAAQTDVTNATKRRIDLLAEESDALLVYQRMTSAEDGWGISEMTNMLAAADVWESSVHAVTAATNALADAQSNLSIIQAESAARAAAIADGTLTGALTFTEAADYLTTAMGGTEKQIETLGKYYQNYFSDAENYNHGMEIMGKQFEELGISMPTTNAGLRALIEAQDETTSSGLDTIAALIGLSAGFNDLTDFADKIVKQRTTFEIQIMELTGDASGALAAQRAIELAALDDSLKPLQEHVWLLQDKTKAELKAKAATEKHIETLKDKSVADYQAAREAVESQRAFAVSVRELQKSLWMGGQSPLASSLGLLRANFVEINALAAGGDKSAQSGLSGATTSYLDAAKSSASSLIEYSRIFAYVQNSLDDTASLTEEQVTVADLQLEELRKSNTWLAGIDAKNTIQNQSLEYLLIAAIASSQLVGQSVSVPYSAANPNPVLVAIRDDAMASALDAGNYGGWSQDLEDAYYAAMELPTFASGGTHEGGWRMVGENGPEIEYTPPSRIFSNSQSRGMMAANDETANEIRAMRDEMRQLLLGVKTNTGEAAKILRKFDGNGLPAERLSA